jgi:hypothetical protein
MDMATLTLKQRTLALPAAAVALKQYNKYAISSLILAIIFLSYFIIPHVGVLSSVFNFSVFYVLVVPALALVLAVLGIRQIKMNKTHDRGIALSYVALGITTFYFMIALAIPLVLLGLYIIYSFIL